MLGPAHIGAAFRDQKRRKRLNLGMHDRAQKAAPVAALGYQPCANKLFQVMGQDRAGYPDRVAKAAHRQAFRPRAHKAAQDRQAML